jgi:hypothetical protein
MSVAYMKVSKVKSSTTQLLSSFVVAERPCVFVVFVFVSSWQLFVGYRLRIMGHEKKCRLSAIRCSLLKQQTTENRQTQAIIFF